MSQSWRDEFTDADSYLLKPGRYPQTFGQIAAHWAFNQHRGELLNELQSSSPRSAESSRYVARVALRQLSHIEGEPERHRRPVGRRGRGPQAPRPGVRHCSPTPGCTLWPQNSMSKSTRTFSVGGS